MFLERTIIVMAGLVLLGFASISAGQGETKGDPAAEQKDRAAVNAWLAQYLPAAGTRNLEESPPPLEPKILRVEIPAVGDLLPEQGFYSVRFMRYPRSEGKPRGLEPENLVRVAPDGTVSRVADTQGLKSFLAGNLAIVRDEKQARAALLAALRLAQEFYQDGQYTYAIAEDSLQIKQEGDHLVARGRADVTEGGQGSVEVVLSFDAAGKLQPQASKIDGRVRPDVRLR